MLTVNDCRNCFGKNSLSDGVKFYIEDYLIVLYEKGNEIIIGEKSLDKKLKDFREKTNLPLRKLAEITGINKDKINKKTK